MNVVHIPSNQWQIIWISFVIVEMYFTEFNFSFPMLSWLEKPCIDLPLFNIDTNTVQFTLSKFKANIHTFPQ